MLSAATALCVDKIATLTLNGTTVTKIAVNGTVYGMERSASFAAFPPRP